MQDRLQKGLPSVAITGLPIAIPLHTALRRFDIAFRVAGFVRADLTLFPEMSPVTCEGDTALVLADCDESMPLRISRLDPVAYEFCFVSV